MKTIIYRFLFLFIFTFVNYSITNAQGWLWAKEIGGLVTDNNNGAGIIASDDIFEYGTFESIDCYSETDTFHIRGAEDIFFAKFDNAGNEKWCRRIGGFGSGINEEQISNVILDPLGNNLYMTGNFSDSILIGSVNLHGNNKEIFIAKFDTNGNFIWAKSAGSSEDDSGTGIVIDSLGNLYLSAFCFGQANFDSFTVQPGTILAKFDTSGNCLWAKNIMRNISCTVLFNNNHLFLAGVSFSNVDTLYIDSIKILANGSTDIIISQFDTTGKVIWAIKEGWLAGDYISGYSLDENGNIYIAGSYGSDSTIFNEDTLRNAQTFLVKYNSFGIYQWITQFTASSQILASRGIKSDHQGNVYVTGFFGDTALFGNYSIIAQSNLDGFLTCYSSNGFCLGVDKISYGLPAEVAVDINNRPVISGHFSQVTTAAGTVYSHGSMDAAVIMHDAITNVNESKRNDNKGLLIYANPTNGKCHITIPDEFKNNNSTLTLNLFDNSGKIIRSYPIRIKDSTIKLDLEYEATGIYVVTLSDGQRVYRGKIVFE